MQIVNRLVNLVIAPFVALINLLNKFDIQVFIDRVPVLGALWSLLTSEAVIASIAGVIATWFTAVEADQPFIAGLIGLLTLLFVRPRVERDANIAAIKLYLQTNKDKAVKLVAGALGLLRVPITINGVTYWFDLSEAEEKNIAKWLVENGIKLIPDSNPSQNPTNEQLIRASMR